MTRFISLLFLPLFLVLLFGCERSEEPAAVAEQASVAEQESVGEMHAGDEAHAEETMTRPERMGLAELGFEPALFESVSAALDAGTEAEAIAADLDAAEAHLEMLAARAGGDPADIIRFLMATVSEEYAIAVNDGVVTDPGEYQDAYGFTEVAKGHAATLDADTADEVMTALDALASVWTGAPIPSEDPVLPVEVDRRVAAVIEALRQL